MSTYILDAVAIFDHAKTIQKRAAPTTVNQEVVMCMLCGKTIWGAPDVDLAANTWNTHDHFLSCCDRVAIPYRCT